MKVRDVMTTRVVSVTPETPLKEVARLLADNGISGVPVIGESGDVLGVVSEADFLLKEQEQDVPTGRRSLLSWLFEGIDGQRDRQDKLHATTAGEAMTSPAVVIGPGHEAREAAAIMTRGRINRLPVVEDGELVGIVTRADLVETFLVPDAELERRIREEIVRDTMWMSPDDVQVSVTEGVAALSGTVDRRSTATIVERLVGHLDGVVGVRSELAWELDDRDMDPVGRLEHEPTAASVTAREHPR
ncbi:MAG TPA: CBS domain-containing protein [Candidatus Limnocylindria bacterium]